MKRRTKGLLAGGILSGTLVLSGAGVALAGGFHRLPDPGRSPVTTLQGTAPSHDDAGSMMGGDGSAMMGGNGNGGMMGMMDGSGACDMMGGSGTHGMMGGPVQVTSPASAHALSQRAAATATIDRQTNTITYHAPQVQLVALASPDGGPDMTWNVDGLVNPTVGIPTGAHVTVHFFDADNGTMHGWEITTTPPPYAYMAMMDAPVALSGAFAMPVSGATAQHWFGRTVQFTASSAGTYYYICPVPGHAQKRMYGTVIVR